MDYYNSGSTYLLILIWDTLIITANVGNTKLFKLKIKI